MALPARALGTSIGLALTLAVGTLGLSAPDDPKPAPAPAARKPHDPARRVPPLFNQVGVTGEQKEQIYALRAKHQRKIAELKKQLDEERKVELAECETVLTEAQKRQLATRRVERAQPKVDPAAPTATKTGE